MGRRILQSVGLACGAALLGAALFWAPMLSPSKARGADEPQYRLTATTSDLRDVLEGRRTIDSSEVDGCEKARDLCLIALCATTERKNARPACWERCTEVRYAKCLEKQREQR